MKCKKGSLVKLPPDEAAKYSSKLRLVDMKGSKYRVLEDFDTKPTKVKSDTRKATNKK